MRMSLCAALLAMAALPARAQDAERWDLTNARVAVRLNLELLGDLGVRVVPAARAEVDGRSVYSLGADGRLVASAPRSIFRTVTDGSLRLSGGPAMRAKGLALTFEGAILRPGPAPRTYAIDAADGSPLFVADHQHVRIDREARTARFFNLGLRLAADLAGRLGHPLAADIGIGVLEIEADAGIPAGSREQPDGACQTPVWGLPDNDVALTQSSGLQQFANAGGLFVAAPSATLKNVGTTDVPWIEMFSATLPPYNNDQHPFLVWNMYRIAEGRLDQIGASGAKHAFLTINFVCGCAPGNILWAANGGCEDEYDSGTNDSPFSLGPRTEITAHTGVWQRCGSIFDANCDNVRDPVIPFTGASDKRRMGVAAADVLDVSKGTQFFYDAWYLVRDDVDIFNTMVHQRIRPVLSGGLWTFIPVGAQAHGSVIDAWVNPAAPGTAADYERVDTGEGLLTVAMRAVNKSGLWRYDYAVMNHSFDRRLESFAMQVPVGATVSGMAFHDVDRDAATDWLPSTAPGSLSWTAPAGVPTAPQDWGLLYSFSFTTTAAPSAAAASSAVLGIEEAPGGQIVVPIMGPQVP